MTEQRRQDAEGHNAGVQAMRDEAIRVINAMPRWLPGKQQGKPVRCKYVLPITYRLQ
jgi:protein TonB